MRAVTLEQIAAIATEIFNGEQIDIVRNDYDDYGSECFVIIKGECADLIVEEKFDDDFKCQISGHRTEDLSCEVSYNHRGIRGGIARTHHFSQFFTKENVDFFESYKLESISKWLIENAKYLKASVGLFERVDNINYPDLRGEEKWGNGITSYDRFVVCDEDFYLGSKIKETRRTRLVREHDIEIDPDDFY